MKLRTALAIGLSCLVEGTGADLDTGSVAARRKLRGRSRGSRDLVSVSNDLVSNDVNFDGLLSLTSTSDAAEAEEGATATTPPTEAAEIATDPPAAPRTVCSSIIAVSAAYSPNATYADLAGRLVPHGDEGAAAAEGDVELDYAALEADADARASSTMEDFVCELPTGAALPIDGEEDQILELRAMLNRGDIVSGETAIEVERDYGGVAGLMDTSTSVRLPAGGIRLVVQPTGDGRRRLKTKAKYEGVKKVLVVRVIDKKGRAPSGNAKVRGGV